MTSSDHGVLAGRRFDESADEGGHIFGGCHQTCMFYPIHDFCRGETACYQKTGGGINMLSFCFVGIF